MWKDKTGTVTQKRQIFEEDKKKAKKKPKKKPKKKKIIKEASDSEEGLESNWQDGDPQQEERTVDKYLSQVQVIPEVVTASIETIVPVK